jgi:hypothetical protein
MGEKNIVGRSNIAVIIFERPDLGMGQPARAGHIMLPAARSRPFE